MYSKKITGKDGNESGVQNVYLIKEVNDATIWFLIFRYKLPLDQVFYDILEESRNWFYIGCKVFKKERHIRKVVYCTVFIIDHLRIKYKLRTREKVSLIHRGRSYLFGCYLWVPL